MPTGLRIVLVLLLTPLAEAQENAEECIRTSEFNLYADGTRDREIRNECADTVSVAWCFGRGAGACGTPSSFYRLEATLAPGESRQVRNDSSIRWAACFSPDTVIEVGLGTYRCGDEEEDPAPEPEAEDVSDAANSCQYANDLVCDGPQLCEPGTDTNDCWENSRRSAAGQDCRMARRPRPSETPPRSPRGMHG